MGVKAKKPESRGWSGRFKEQYNRTRPVLQCLMLGLLAACAQASELKPGTAAAFERYIRATEAQRTADLGNGVALVIDGLPDPARKEAYAKLHQGELYIEPLHSKEDGHRIPIHDGLVHHWVGTIFIPGARLSEVLVVLQNYDNQQNVYKPYVRRSKLVGHNGNEYRIYLQLFQKSIATVVINANFDVHYAMPGPTQAVSQSYSTRIAEVENPDKPNEHELPVGNDHGYLWRLDSYWNIEEKDGGAYVQVESIALTRSIPPLVAWLVNPLVRSIPRSVLSNLLTATREAVREANPRTTAPTPTFAHNSLHISEQSR